MNSRIEFKKPTYYSNKVLVGPWVDNRANLAPLKLENYKLSSNYNDDFGYKISKKYTAVEWDQRIRSKESNFIPQIARNQFPNYFENFSSTYDLAFNHFPKCFPAHINRTLRFRFPRYEPLEDYIPSFGNLTQYGLKEQKKSEWDCGVEDPRKNLSTNYRDTFTPPSRENYNLKRTAIPLKNSSIMNDVNKIQIRLKLRENKPLCNVASPDDGLVSLAAKAHFDPITCTVIPEKRKNKSIIKINN